MRGGARRGVGRGGGGGGGKRVVNGADERGGARLAVGARRGGGGALRAKRRPVRGDRVGGFGREREPSDEVSEGGAGVVLAEPRRQRPV